MQMTKQEIFSEAYKRIMKQGRPAMKGDYCAYRNAEGLRCGVGILMNDEEIERYANFGSSVKSLVVADENMLEGSVLRPFFKEHAQLLQDIQVAHDRAAEVSGFVKTFHERMYLVAREHKLEVPE